MTDTKEAETPADAGASNPFATETVSDGFTSYDDYSNDHATFGDRLAAARDAAGLGQGQLAKRLGVKRVTIANWEEDRAEPRANRLQMLAGVLNVSLIWLMTGEGRGLPDQGEGEVDVTLEDILRELSQIRAEHRRLAERSGRLEKRLRALVHR